MAEHNKAFENALFGRMTTLTEEVESMNTGIQSLNQKLDILTVSIQGINNILQNHEARISGLETDVDIIRRKVCP